MVASPVRNASYFATLFVLEKASLCKMVIVWTSGLVNTTPIPPTAVVDEPSKCNLQKSSIYVITQVFSGTSPSNSSITLRSLFAFNCAIKSMTARLLIAFSMIQVILNSVSWSSHFASRSESTHRVRRYLKGSDYTIR